MTEEQAITKWCPFARTRIGDNYGHAAVNRGRQPIREECRCIASECMAWRWLTKPESTIFDDGDGCCGLAT